MILGTESYTNFPMVPKGMFYNPYNNLLFIWGNFLLQRYGAGPILPLSVPSGWGPFLKSSGFQSMPKSRSYQDSDAEDTGCSGQGWDGEAAIVKLWEAFLK